MTLHVPAVKATHHLIGAPELQQMKPSAILVNTARGAVVDDEALLRRFADTRSDDTEGREGRDVRIGGLVTASQLAAKGARVLVLERGRRFSEKSLPGTDWDLKKHQWMPSLRCFGIWENTLLNGIMINYLERYTQLPGPGDHVRARRIAGQLRGIAHCRCRALADLAVSRG